MSILGRRETPASSPKPQARFHLRWVLAHEPVALFEPAAREFSRLVEEGTGGEVRVDVLSMSDYAAGRKLTIDHVMDELASGRMMMVQSPLTSLGHWLAPFWALEAPLLFKSNEHATRVLDGAIGRSLLDTLTPRGLRGLAFTYSGGPRIVSTATKKLRRADDYQGLRMRICHSPVPDAAMRSLGAVPVQAPVSKITELTRAGKIDGAESTWARYWDQRHDASQPIVHETGHSYLLTAIVLQEKIFQSMPPAVQTVLTESAALVARREREFSLEQGAKARAAAMAAGVQVVEFDPGERELFEARLRAAGPAIRSAVGGGLLDAISAQA